MPVLSAQEYDAKLKAIKAAKASPKATREPVENHVYTSEVNPPQRDGSFEFGVGTVIPDRGNAREVLYTYDNAKKVRARTTDLTLVNRLLIGGQMDDTVREAFRGNADDLTRFVSSIAAGHTVDDIVAAADRLYRLADAIADAE